MMYFFQKQISKINRIKINRDYNRLSRQSFAQGMIHALCKQIIHEANNKSDKKIDDVDVFQRQCIKISLKAFDFFLQQNVPVEYVIGSVCYKGKKYFECNYNSIANNMKQFDKSMRFNVHAWLLIEKEIILDLTLKATIEGKFEIFCLSESDQSHELQYFPVILTSTPFDLLEKLGFYLVE